MDPGLLTKLLDQAIQKTRSTGSDRGGIAGAPSVRRPVQLPSGTGTCDALTRWQYMVCYAERGPGVNSTQLLRQQLSASGEQYIGLMARRYPGPCALTTLGLSVWINGSIRLTPTGGAAS